MDWKNLILAGAGVALAPYTGGASLALTGSALAAHGTKAAEAKLNTGADQAIALQQQQQQQAQRRIDSTQAQQGQAFQPYMSLGAGAASTLGSRLGLPPSSSAPGNAALPYSPNTQLTSIDPGNAQGIVSNPNGPPLSNSAGVSSEGRPLGELVGQAVARQQTQSSFTPMFNPADGTTRNVPNDRVAFFQKKGAQVVQQGAS